MWVLILIDAYEARGTDNFFDPCFAPLGVQAIPSALIFISIVCLYWIWDLYGKQLFVYLAIWTMHSSLYFERLFIQKSRSIMIDTVCWTGSHFFNYNSLTFLYIITKRRDFAINLNVFTKMLITNVNLKGESP